MPSGRSTSCRALAAEPVRQNANGRYDIEGKHGERPWPKLNTNIRVL